MTVVRKLIRVSALISCAAATFGFVQVYYTAQEEFAQETESGANVEAPVKLADNGDPTKALSPIFPATPGKNLLNVPPPVASLKAKHANTKAKHAQTVVGARRVKTPVRMASRVAKHMPMQLSSSNQNEQRVTYGYAPEQEPRAAGIFRLFP
jgi:hypothetical protein